jgi:hypothetical protein
MEQVVSSASYHPYDGSLEIKKLERYMNEPLKRKTPYMKSCLFLFISC